MESQTITPSPTDQPGPLAAMSESPVPQRIFVVLLALLLAATCLLTSAGHGTEEGQQEWKGNSALRVVTTLMNLDFQYATPRGTEVKWLTLALGAAAALAAAAIFWFLRSRDERDDFDEPGVVAPAGKSFAWVRAMSPTTAAMVALGVFSAWMVASAYWARWPQAAFYEGLRQVICLALAVAIGRTLSRDAVRQAAWVMLGVLTLTAGVGLWYYYERNWGQRLKYPIGNPIFLAACLMPAITIGAGLVWSLARPARSAPSTDAQRSIGVRGALAAGIVVCIAVVLWAMIKSDSRGPGLGLLLGMLMAAILFANPRMRWTIAGAAGIALLAAGSMKLWPISWVLSRPDTIRTRLYAWKYAFQLFLSRPDFGRGQGAFALLSPELAHAPNGPLPSDFERDPPAFVGEMLGHAHNEWLEILADLGAIGLAFIVTSILLTLWAALVAWRRDTEGKHRPVIAALTAAFLAIVFESGTDVGLRMPGLPVIFYCVWGMLWAVSRSETERVRTARPVALRVVGLVAGLAASWGMGWLGVLDWQAALASPRSMESLRQGKWENAVAQAHASTQHRLYIEGSLGGLYRLTMSAHAAAADRTAKFRELMLRIGETSEDTAAGRANRASQLQIAREDALFFQSCLGIGANAAETLLNYSPLYVDAAAAIGDLWTMRALYAQAEATYGSLGLPPLKSDPLEQARLWFMQEFTNNRFDADLGIRILQLSESQPMAARIDLLRIPLRPGPVHPGAEAALAHLVQQEGFGAAMDTLMAAAAPAITGKATPWPDPYSPETLRIAAMANKLRGAFAEAAGMAHQAAAMLDSLRKYFPVSASYALQDEAKYLLLARPEKAEEALAAAMRALELWPERDKGGRSDALKLVTLYQLAAGQEGAAREVIQSLLPDKAGPQAVDKNVGAGYAELCQRFLMLPADKRPRQFREWLQRSLLLFPNYPQALVIAINVTLESGQEDVAVENLMALGQATPEREQFVAFVYDLIHRFPNALKLQQYVLAQVPEIQPRQGPDTQPESGLPPALTQPEDAPGLSIRAAGSRPTTRPE